MGCGSGCMSTPKEYTWTLFLDTGTGFISKGFKAAKIFNYAGNAPIVVQGVTVPVEIGTLEVGTEERMSTIKKVTYDAGAETILVAVLR